MGRDTVVAKFRLRSSRRRSTESEMLASIIYQILCQRPDRFLDIEDDARRLHGWSSHRLRVILGLILSSEHGNGENFVMVINRVDRTWDGDGSPLRVLGEIQAFCPFRIIATSKAEIRRPRISEILLEDSTTTSSSSRRNSIRSSRHSPSPPPPAFWRGSPSTRHRASDGPSRDADFSPIESSDSRQTNEALHRACELGDVAAVRRAFYDGVDAETPVNDRGFTPLHTAARYNHPDVARELLHRNVNAFTTDGEGSSPLHIACRYGSQAVIEPLLDAMQDRLPTDSRLRTPLHAAALNANVNIFRQILDHYLGCWGRTSSRASLLALEELLLRTDADGRNVLHTAAETGSGDIIKEILVRAASHDNQSNTFSLEEFLLRSQDLNAEFPLHLAARHGHTGTVGILCQSMDQKLISARNAAGKTPLHLACSGGYYEAVSELLGYRASLGLVDKDNLTPVMEAARAGSGDTVRLLCREGASLLPQAGGSPLYEAVVAQNEDLTTAILDIAGEEGTDLRRQADLKGRLPVMWAAQKGNRRIFDRLLADPTQFSIKDADWNSVLHYAAEGGNVRIVSVLLGKRWLRSHINSPNRFGYTPLQSAAKAGSMEVVDTLLHHGAHIVANKAIALAATDEIALRLLERSAGFVEAADLADAVHNAAREGHLGTLRIITSPDIAIRPDPNFPDGEEKTALILAAEAGQTEIVRYLAANIVGVKINARDNARRTPISYAAENGHIGVVELLASYGEVDLTTESGFSPLVYAAMNGHLLLVKALESACTARYGKTDQLSIALCAAAEGGHIDIVQFLLEKGADPLERRHAVVPAQNSWSQAFNALEHALVRGHVEIISRLSDFTPESWEPYRARRLQLACNHPDGLAAYLHHCRDVDEPDENGVTALSYAVQNGHLVAAQLLLEAKADPARQDVTGKSPLHYAVAPRKPKLGKKLILDSEFTELLLRYSTSDTFQVQDQAGNTPLVDAIRAGTIYSVRALLVKDDKSIQFPASEGRQSPLWIALETSAFEIARLILELADLRVLTGSHHELVAVASRRAPRMQLALLKSLPGINVRLEWVQGLVRNDTTGVIVRYLLQQGAVTWRVDDHGWSLTDFAYATDPRRCWTKSDAEITRTANQVYHRPRRWLPMGEEGYPYLGIHGKGLVVRYSAPYDTVAVTAAVRSDHPIPPHRAYYFEIRIANVGLDAGLIGVGLCTSDTTVSDLTPSANTGPKPRQNLRYVYYGSGLVEKSGRPYAEGDRFSAGDVIGCHIDFARGMAYFRKNGGRIGLLHRLDEILPVSGRLFPMVVTASIGCEVVAGFDQASPVYYEREEGRCESDGGGDLRERVW
ncbi:ankyrin repeat-containing domain protein [Echria macrotheca]|uniref:Ankyrin repeat-containing domain protein n=1 Tax=Echria macrotheca TaxID=438768 RepID=A0AAJ0F3G9_9PEZI|nr:ankyrin repeat-containing domain protein [Echria macrotheca]